MSNKGKYYMTTAIAYTSGKPHIGNTYEIVLADAIARYKRAEGYDVYFQTGTDEHGQKIQEKAEAAGITPKEFVDGVAGEVKEIWDLMNTSYDNFVRTTDADHEKCVKKIFKKLYDQGDIYKSSYEGLYCTPCESFWTESQLVDGKCPDCGREVKPAKEEAYFFKMSKYADRLIDYINTHPEFIQPVSRKNEMMNNFLLPGLQDLCVSRTSFSWGIPVDFDPKHAHGTTNLKRQTSSTAIIMDAVMELYDRIVDKKLLVRRITITANKLVSEDFVQEKESYEQLQLFTDYEEVKRGREKEEAALEKEKRIQHAMLDIKKKFGKNAILKGMNLEEGATTKERNEIIGGHKA